VAASRTSAGARPARHLDRRGLRRGCNCGRRRRGVGRVLGGNRHEGSVAHAGASSGGDDRFSGEGLGGRAVDHRGLADNDPRAGTVHASRRHRAGQRSDAPTATAAPAHEIALYGDSLTVMAWDHYQWITAADVTTDSHRWDGTEIGDWRDSILSNPHDHLVLALGTNDAERDGAGPWADVLNKLPASKCIVWPKPYEGSSKVKLFNTQMAAIVAAHPNVHVIDWDSQVKAHPEWVRDDHTHYEPDGSDAYAEMLKQAALMCG
jgi:hypothetical protein